MSNLTEQVPIPEVDDADRVVDLVARLPHGSIVRRLALQVIQGRKLESAQPLYSTLITPLFRRWRERQMAAWALGRTALATEDRDAVVALLMDVVEGGHRESFWSRAKRGIIVTSAASFASFILACAVFGPPRGGGSDGLDILAILFGIHCVLGVFCLPMTLWHESMISATIRAAAAESLGRMDSVEAVGTLAGTLQDGSHEVRAASAVALHRLLPLVSPEHYGSFGVQSMQNLGRALFSQDGQLVYKVLTALEHAGTSAAIPYVQRAARSGRTTRVRDAAANLLLTLEARRIRETERDRLLRPTNGLHDAAVLLRAPESATEDVSLLLRPTSDGG